MSDEMSLPDLVQDSKLETKIRRSYIEHLVPDTGTSADQRLVTETQQWERDKSRPVLARGTYGIVYLERCRSKNKARALKEIPKEIIHSEGLDYKRELEAIFKFSNKRYAHCFVRSDGWFESPSSVYISMEYLPNGDLETHLTRPVSEIETKQIISQVLEGIGYMHTNRFTHRDLKPGNILVVTPSPGWYVKIADFGICKRRQEGVTLNSTANLGTPGYCAPETLGSGQGSSWGYAVDMWSLGVVTYRILTNSTVFSNTFGLFEYGKGHQLLPTGMETHGVSSTGQDFVKRLLAFNPENRLTASDAAQHHWLKTHDETSLNGEESDSTTEFVDVETDIETISEPSAAWTTQTSEALSLLNPAGTEHEESNAIGTQTPGTQTPGTQTPGMESQVSNGMPNLRYAQISLSKVLSLMNEPLPNWIRTPSEETFSPRQDNDEDTTQTFGHVTLFPTTIYNSWKSSKPDMPKQETSQMRSDSPIKDMGLTKCDKTLSREDQANQSEAVLLIQALGDLRVDEVVLHRSKPDIPKQETAQMRNYSKPFSPSTRSLPTINTANTTSTSTIDVRSVHNEQKTEVGEEGEADPRASSTVLSISTQSTLDAKLVTSRNDGFVTVTVLSIKGLPTKTGAVYVEVWVKSRWHPLTKVGKTWPRDPNKLGQVLFQSPYPFEIPCRPDDLLYLHVRKARLVLPNIDLGKAEVLVSDWHSKETVRISRDNGVEIAFESEFCWDLQHRTRKYFGNYPYNGIQQLEPDPNLRPPSGTPLLYEGLFVIKPTE